ncbi:isoprenylcysteine carboxyl methyltransferase family protein [Streptantibioticus rubrisoli]|uniref:Isoprenylcysteine carboxyl methyltransferase family protein n=1 Tax=Streptantibioticus rubrisoli TaxID=1387313 RepID=A0ABT1PIZ9_9ACTN|nr:isoprenylcysteine carboxyl methyltransferase family protein [Streptantibioticus rubrisoli]MCQ4045336.1 isoprenylcysteine carboxyl methyltransferase family protein [Streptantibioticus rubrisoli]
MGSSDSYLLLVALVALERAVELVVARRNRRWTLARGGVEAGRRHYPFIVAAHSALLLACPIEVALGHRPFLPVLGWPMLALVVLAQCLRWWCVMTLGPYWNTRVIVVPGAAQIRRGPYRFLRHPNYLAVVIEGSALPLVHTAWLAAGCFTFVDAILLTNRLKCENQALYWSLRVRGDREARRSAEPGTPAR